MKKFILLLFNFLSSASLTTCFLIFNYQGAFAQTNVYHPFPDSNFIWVEHSSGVGGNCCCSGNCLWNLDYQYYLNGDTLISPYLYKKIYKSGMRTDFVSGPPTCPPWCSSTNTTYFNSKYVGSIRQDTMLRKVYFVSSFTQNKDTLLYNFNLNTGDTLSSTYINAINSCYVSKIDSLLIGEKYHKKFHISSIGNKSPFVFLIEGIGSTYGLLTYLAPPFETLFELICATSNLLTIYPDTTTKCDIPTNVHELQNSATLNIHPNPANSQIEIIFTEYSKERIVTIFNAIGQMIYRESKIEKNEMIDISTFTNGLYFIQVIDNNTAYSKIFLKK